MRTMRINMTRWVLIGASLWMGTVRSAEAQQTLTDGWAETEAWHLSHVPSKPITAYPAGDLWADFCTEPVYFHHPCGRNDCTGDGTCTLLDGVNAYHAPLGSRCGSCGINRCSTCAPAGEVTVLDPLAQAKSTTTKSTTTKSTTTKSTPNKSALTKSTSPSTPAPIVQGNRARRSAARTQGQPTPAVPRHQAARKANPKSERPRSVRVEAVDGRPRPVTMEPMSPVPLAPADLVAAAASETAQWVEGIPESAEADQTPDVQVQQAAAYEPVADELHDDGLYEVEVQTAPIPVPVVRQASHIRSR